MGDIEVVLTVQDLGYADVYRPTIDVDPVAPVNPRAGEPENFGGPLISATALYNAIQLSISRRLKGNYKLPYKPSLMLKLLAGNLQESDLSDEDKGILTALAESVVSSVSGKFAETFPYAKNIVIAAALGSIGWIVADYVGGLSVKIATVGACVLFAFYAEPSSKEESKLVTTIKDDVILALEKKYGVDMWDKLVFAQIQTIGGARDFFVFPDNLPRIRAQFNGAVDTTRYLQLDIKLNGVDERSWLYIRRDPTLTPAMVHTALTDPNTVVAIRYTQAGSGTYQIKNILPAEKQSLLKYYDALPADTAPDWSLFGTDINNTKQIALVTANDGFLSWFGSLFGLSAIGEPAGSTSEELRDAADSGSEELRDAAVPDDSSISGDSAAEPGTSSQEKQVPPTFGFGAIQMHLISFGARKPGLFP